MVLLEGLPGGFEAMGLVVRVRVGSAFWMWLSTKIQGLDNRQAFDLLEQSITGMYRNGCEVESASITPAESERIFERLLWFMRGGAEENRESSPRKGHKLAERLIDYERDLDAIYAAFLQSYGIDLYDESNGSPLIENMHWWRFLALVSNLPPGSTLVDYYMHYRGLDPSRLPRKSPEERKRLAQVLEVKRRVSLNKGKQKERNLPKYHYAAVKLKEGGENVADSR